MKEEERKERKVGRKRKDRTRKQGGKETEGETGRLKDQILEKRRNGLREGHTERESGHDEIKGRR